MQIVVLMALLSRMLSWQSALTGLAVTLSIIPLSIVVGRWQTRIRAHVVQRTDARVKLTGEVLSGQSVSFRNAMLCLSTCLATECLCGFCPLFVLPSAPITKA